MKRFILPLLAGLVAVFSCKDNNTYVINGKILDGGSEGCEVYLRHGMKTDTAVVKAGAFRFEGVAETPEVGRIIIFNDQTPKPNGPVVLEPGKITVTVSDLIVPAGTPLNDDLGVRNAEITKAYNDYRALVEKIRLEPEWTPEEKLMRTNDAAAAYNVLNEQYNRDLFAAHTNDILGVSPMLVLGRGNKPVFDSLYAAAGEFVRNHPDIDAEHNRLEQVARTSVGAMFTDFTIEHGNADGSAVRLSDYVGKGKFVLVDFWASWCGPCKEEMPNLKDVYERYKGDRFELVGIAVSDKRADTEAAVAKLELPWPIIYDAQSIPSEIYGVNAIPHIILFDPDGKIVARDLRGGMIGEFVGALLRGYSAQ